MVAVMQSYCLIRVSQLALTKMQTCKEVDQREEHWFTRLRSILIRLAVAL